MYTNVNINVPRRYCSVTTSKQDVTARRKAKLPLLDLPYSLTITNADTGIIRYAQYFKGKLSTSSTSTGLISDNQLIVQRCTPLLDDQVGKLQANRRNKILAKIKGQSLPLIMLYRERKQTESLLGDFGKDMLFFARNYKNPRRLLRHYGFGHDKYGNRALVRRLLKQNLRHKTVGDAYLSWRFGWSPLWADLKASFEAASIAEKQGFDTKSVTRMNFEYHADTNLTTYDKSRGYMGGKGSVSGVFLMAYRYRITDTTLNTASQIMDIPTTIWDSVPWSFLIDRLVNVSKYLDLRNATAGVAFSSGYETLFREYTFTPEDTFYQLDNMLQVWNYSSLPARTTVRMNRTVLSSFNQPTLEYPYEEFFDSKYWGDLFFLVRQKFRRKP